MTAHTASEAPGARGDAGDDVGSDDVEGFVQRHPEVVKFAQIGWAAKGIVYLLTGVLAFTIVAKPQGSSGQSSGSTGQADTSGAVSTIARQPYGMFLLWLMAAGLFVYAAWRLVTVVLPADMGAHAILRRIGYTVSAASYIVLGVTAISLARKPGSSSGSGGSSQDSQVDKVTRSIMEGPAGRWLVAIGGVAVVGLAAYFLYKAVTASFEKELEHRSVGPFSWHFVRAIGRAGWIGRSAMMALIGVFLTRAAVNFDPEQASGLDDSLRRVVDNDFGMVLVVIVALGLTLYGAFCVISSPARKVVASDEDTVAS